MNVLSLFDGMSCGQIAFNKSGIKIDKYFASEIDKDAIKVCLSNFPGTIQLGDVLNINLNELPFIDILIGGSPCQDISNLSKFRLGLDGEKSKMFYEYYRIYTHLKSINPNLIFLLENVRGNKTAIKSITKLMGVRPMKFNSNMIVAQNRPRMYWTNIPVNSIPIKRYQSMNDILQSDVESKYYQSESWNLWWSKNKDFQLSKSYSSLNPQIASCLTKRMYASWNGNFVDDKNGIRRLTPIECERLQCVPDNYTNYVTDTKRYEMLGNGWTVDVIAHIFKHIPR